MLGLIIVHDETGVNHSRDPAEESEQQAEHKTQEPAGHEHGDRWKDDAKKVAERFHGMPQSSRVPRQAAINDRRKCELRRRIFPGPVPSAIRRTCAILPGYAPAWLSGRFAIGWSRRSRWRIRQRRDFPKQ